MSRTPQFRVVGPEELRKAVGLADLFEPVREALITFDAGHTVIGASVLSLREGEVHVKSASGAGSSIYVIKVASSVRMDAGGAGGSSGGLLVGSARTGRPIAFLYDGGYLTDLRTAALGALVTDRLARHDARVVALVGTGTQAYWQAVALRQLRPFDAVLIWGRRLDRAEALAERLAGELDVGVTASNDLEALIRAADIVITTTASDKPLVEGRWLHSGQHITALGADDLVKRELDAACLQRADRLFVDSRAQTVGLAELRRAIADGAIDADAVSGEVGALLCGAVEGRRSDDEITIAKLTGIGAQDLAAAEVALRSIDPRLLA